MKIGALADRAGVNASAIRYYERLGLLKEPHRIGGQRRYAEDAISRVLLIRFAGDMGFTLPEISVFLDGLRDDAPVGRRWKKLARAKLDEVQQGIARAQKLKILLEHLLRCHCASLQMCVDRLDLSPRRKAIVPGSKQRRIKRTGRRRRIETNHPSLNRGRFD
jgi:MerR family redox-sensitive transcriptional activator SoxR